MKHIFKYILIFSAALFTSMSIQAQTPDAGYKNQNGVSTGKTVSGPNSDGTYTISLETFATGTSSLVSTTKPVNVVLVLDVSGSMAWPKGDYSTSTKTSYSYNDIVNGNVEYFRRYSQSSDYIEKIYAEEVNGRYYLYISPDQGTGNYQGTYLTSNGGTTTGRSNAAYATSATAAIVTPSTGNNGNSRYFFQGTSRIKALQDAVCTFIDQIETNDLHVTDEDGNIVSDRDERLGNKIAIVQFAGSGATSYNDNQTIVTLRATEGNVESMKNTVNALVPKGATQAGSGMNLANTELGKADADASKVVVMFTDGEPSDNYAAIGNTSNGGTNAYRAKHTYEALVYTVGLFTTSPQPTGSTANVWNYLNYVSSNYPNATVNNNGNMSAGSGGDSTAGYYKDASGNADLTAIFKEIASGIGGSEETIGSSTQVRDVVTSSFVIPSGTASGLTVEVWKVDRTTQEWKLESTNPEGITATIGKKTYTENGQQVKKDTVGVTGFDFSKDDTTEGAGDGNWVGLRYDSDNQPFYAGRKLVISFKILENEGATGGVGSATNTSESGVYVLKEDGTYENVNAYEVPHTTLPVNIKITKTGLRHGESATFQIFKIAPKRDTLVSVLTGQRDSVVMRYNPIGKPLPNEKEYTPQDGDDAHDILEGKGWEKWSKVILTNKGADKVAVTKTLVSLDPNWVYLVTEDDWSWSYTTTGTGEYQTTSTVELNPFSFTNTEKTNVPKHAEAVTINHFGYTISGGEFDGKQEEHYKSSKTKL